MRGLDLYEAVREQIERQGLDWPAWGDLSSDERHAWELADDEVYERYSERRELGFVS